MSEREQAGVTIEVLQRMITYLRQEALRLRVMDVAVLLEHAEEAVASFAPGALSDRSCLEAAPEGSRLEH